MALPDLISRLEQEAQSQVQAFSRRPTPKCARSKRRPNRPWPSDVRASSRDGSAERQVVQQRELALARRQAHARELEARHALLARILERAPGTRARGGHVAPYLGALPSHLEEALSYLEGLRPRVRCQAALARRSCSLSSLDSRVQSS